MTPDLETVIEIIQSSNCQFKDEILKEMEGFVQIGSVNTHKVSGAISVFGIKADFINKEDPAALGFEELLSNLKNFKEDDNSDQFMVKGENSGYEVFADFSKSVLHGILKLPQQYINKKTELTSDNQLRGTWAGSRFYLAKIELNKK